MSTSHDIGQHGSDSVGGEGSFLTFTGTQLVTGFVDLILNDGELGRLPQLVAPHFRDHHPVHIPRIYEVARRDNGTVQDIINLVGLLQSESVDFFFHVEDVFQAGDRIAYRLFGEGTVLLPESAVPDGVRPGADGPGSSGGRVIGNRLHLSYTGVGIFRIAGDRLTDRWGIQAFS